MSQPDPGATRALRAAQPTEEEEGDQTVLSAELRPGDAIGEYRVEALIGSGAFGQVVRAVHPVLGREVAIKVLKRQHAADPEVLGRFVAEARAVNRVRHPNIIDVYGFGTLADGRHYYVMDLLRGESLGQRLEARGRLPADEVLAILRPLCGALATAHREGITHRDLKPENVFLCDSPGGVTPRLLDFGVARVPEEVAPGAPRTRQGMVVGTPAYMAPEQSMGDPVDARSDVFALGVLAYQMLTGALPFEGRSLSELLRHQLHGPPPEPVSKRVPDAPAHLDAALRWMLEPEPAARCPDAERALDALEGRLTPPKPEAPKETVNARAAVPAPPAVPAPLHAASPVGPVIASPTLLSRLAEESERAERSPLGRLALILFLAAALFGALLLGLSRDDARVAFQLQGRPAGAEVVSESGELLGTLPGPVELKLPATVEVRAPGYHPERRALGPDSARIQLFTLRPAP